MKEVQVNNQEMKSALDQFLWFYDNRLDLQEVVPNCEELKEDRAHFMSDSYCREIIHQGSAHTGFPDVFYGWNLKSENQRLPESWIRKYTQFNKQLGQLLAVRHTAVASLYPEGGYISWHNNANAPGFNLLFSWSETGDGNFSYIDQSGEKVVLKDAVGEWTCRYGYFGSYNDKHPLVYHSAESNCWRITVAYVLNQKDVAGDLQQMIVEDIITP